MPPRRSDFSRIYVGGEAGTVRVREQPCVGSSGQTYRSAAAVAAAMGTARSAASPHTKAAATAAALLDSLLHHLFHERGVARRRNDVLHTQIRDQVAVMLDGVDVVRSQRAEFWRLAVHRLHQSAMCPTI